MSLFVFIVAGCIMWWLAHQNDKKMNENFFNFSLRCDYLEKRVEELEASTRQNEEDIEYYKRKINTLSQRIHELENPYQNSNFDDLD
ncbi:MAG: hypothetical protein BGN93_19685 [Acinetobacter sp. 39-4]|nr:MAG: hypothetical protein BGN93_19685 [Acinetobacter sp. 39-4]